MITRCEGGWAKLAFGVGGILFDIAQEAAVVFGPLKAVLCAISTIYEKYEVPSLPFTRNTRFVYDRWLKIRA